MRPVSCWEKRGFTHSDADVDEEPCANESIALVLVVRVAVSLRPVKGGGDEERLAKGKGNEAETRKHNGKNRLLERPQYREEQCIISLFGC